MPNASTRRTPPLALSACVVVALVVISAPLASADTQQEREERARELFMLGQQYWEEERYEEASATWLEAYETQPVPIILYNIAQAYRRQGDCPAALYFYQRYVRDDPDSRQSELASEHITSLVRQCEPRSPWADEEPDDDAPDDHEDVAQEEEEPDIEPEIEPQPVAPAPTPMIAAVAEVGPAIAPMGPLDVPMLTSVRVGAGYPLDLGDIELQIGASATFAPVPWSRADESGTALLTGLLANAAARYPIIPDLFARGELGLGALVFSGVAHEDSVFLEPGLAATGALGMFHLRIQGAVEYELTPNIALSASPLVFSFSPPHAGLRDDLGTLTRFEFLAGLAMRL